MGSLDDVGWNLVEETTVLSQGSTDTVSDLADALHETTASDSEPGPGHHMPAFQISDQSEWARIVQEATKGMHDVSVPSVQLRTILLLSGCTGCFAEGAAMKDCFGLGKKG